MKIEKDTIVTLDDGINYVIVETLTKGDRTIACCVTEVGGLTLFADIIKQDEDNYGLVFIEDQEELFSLARDFHSILEDIQH